MAPNKVIKKPTAAKPAVAKKAAPKGAGFSLQGYLENNGDEARLTAIGATARGNLIVVDANGNEGHMFKKTLLKGLEDETLTVDGDEIVSASGFRNQNGIFWIRTEFVAADVI